MGDYQKGGGIFRHCAAASWGCIFVTFLLAYGLAHSALRLTFSRNLPADAVTSNIFAQTFELGYSEWQPPLYEWLLWGLQRLTGPTLLSVLILKYVLLAATLCLLYLAATRLFEDARWAALSALSLLLTYHVGWTLNEALTQTTVLMLAVAGSFWSLMRLVERGGYRDYLLFGAFIGLGALSKYSFGGFVLALGASCMLQPALRARLLTWRTILSIAIAGLILSPFLYWLMTRDHDLASVYSNSISQKNLEGPKATLIGLGLAIFSPLAFLFPLVVILPLCFPRMLREMLNAALCEALGGKEKPDWETLLLHITLAGFLILMLGAVLFGANRYLEVLMFPFFLLTPLWLMKMAQRSMVRLRQAKAFLAIMISLVTAAFFVRVVHLGLEMGPSCKKCRPAIPYEELAAVLREGGIASGTIIAGDGHIAGNLRGLLPYARIVCLQPSYGPPPSVNDFSSTAIVVWQPKGEDRTLPNGAVEEIAKLGGKLRGSPEKVSLKQQPFLSTSTPRHWDWMVQVVDVTPEKM